jgi:hypothetical protein
MVPAMRTIAIAATAAALCFSCGSRKGGNSGVGEPCETVLDCEWGLGCYDGRCGHPPDARSDLLDVSPDLPDGQDGTDGQADPDAAEGLDATDEGGGEDVPADEGPADLPSDGEEDAGREACMFMPPVGEFNPAMECAWRGSDVEPARDDVVSMPVVINVTDDNGDTLINLDDTPDILFITYDLEGDGCCNVPGVIRVVSGRCGSEGLLEEHFTIRDPYVDNSGGLAAGDIDADTLPEIVAMIHPTGTVAFEHDGTVKWRSTDPNGTDDDMCTAVQPSIADLDGDGTGEVIVGRVVLDGLTGATLWRGTEGLGYNAFLGPIAIVADIDLDGSPEVVAGNTAYRADGWPEWVYDYGTSLGTCQGGCGLACDGYNATGNFDDDDFAEIVAVVAERVFVFEHDGTLKVMLTIPREAGYAGYNEGGPPTVADFDGDGRSEIGVAAANYYSVFDLDCTGDPLPSGCEDEGILWKVENNDESSRVTGSSVFDFDGDGSAEVVYNDETHFRIFRGIDGEVLFEWNNYSHTRLEYPVIADVDNDGNAEIVFIENGSSGREPGIEVWGDEADLWVPTRRIWNQHAYHITNIDEDGALPAFERPNWLVYNNYRQNLPDFSPFLAPDLVVEITGTDTSECSAGRIAIEARVCNIGDVRVGEVDVRFYEGDPEDGRGIDCVPDEPGMQGLVTEGTLEPGDCADVTCVWSGVPVAPASADVTACVDDTDWSCTEPGGNNECNEDNNTDILEDVQCERPL